MREAAPTFIRWLWIWVTIAALVVVVVIGFLIGIVSSLSSIDDNLFEADAAVTGISGDAEPLPDAVETINKNLRLIDASLEPIPDQADTILNSLGSIRGKLGAIDSSLGDTDASLENTDASLVDTSNQLGNITSLLNDTAGTLVTISGSLDDTSGTLQGISPSLDDTSGMLEVISPSLDDTSGELVSVLALARRIDTTLKAAQRSEAGEGDDFHLGTNGIWRRVRFLNGGAFDRPGDDKDTSLAGPNDNPNGLEPVEDDATAIIGGLIEINKHLTSICEAPVLQVPIPLLVNPGPC
ncbi:MAG TPA: hypothetical protein VGR22_01985 [Thermomicrobiales bacterium]|nr:hypothetical protein [Thermomicrobiales bacterium]